MLAAPRVVRAVVRAGRGAAARQRIERAASVHVLLRDGGAGLHGEPCDGGVVRREPVRGVPRQHRIVVHGRERRDGGDVLPAGGGAANGGALRVGGRRWDRGGR